MAVVMEDLRPRDQSIRVLHVAPEPSVRQWLRRLPDAEILTMDLSSGHVDVLADLAVGTPFPDGSFDWILCSHVLEHIPDDKEAIRELERILKPTGTAFIVVPIRRGVQTYEDFTITDARDRIRAFGQHDHVRVYGDDFVERLEDVFAVTTRPVRSLPETDRERHRIDDAGALETSTIYLCRPKPAPPMSLGI